MIKVIISALFSSIFILEVSSAESREWISPSFEEVVRLTSFGVVRIEVNAMENLTSSTGEKPFTSFGSGFVADGNGHVITAAHLIPDKKNMSNITISGAVGSNIDGDHQHKLNVVHIDRGLDYAILKFDEVPSLARALPIGSNVPQGSSVYLLGYPAGMTTISVDQGIWQQASGTRVQFNSIANQGNSGGPLIDGSGNVVGIVSARIEVVSGTKVQGLNKSVPSTSFTMMESIVSPMPIFLENSWESEFDYIPEELDTLKYTSHCNVVYPKGWKILKEAKQNDKVIFFPPLLLTEMTMNRIILSNL